MLKRARRETLHDTFDRLVVAVLDQHTLQTTYVTFQFNGLSWSSIPPTILGRYMVLCQCLNCRENWWRFELWITRNWPQLSIR